MSNPRPDSDDPAINRLHENMDLMDAGYQCECPLPWPRSGPASPYCPLHSGGDERRSAIAVVYGS